MAGRKRLGDILLQHALVDDEQLQEALQMQQQSGEKLGEALVKLGHVTPEQLADALAEHLGIERVDFSRRYLDKQALELVPEELRKDYQVLPVEVLDHTLVVAMVDPLNIMQIDDLQRATGLLIQPLVATREEIKAASQRASDITSSARKVFAEYEEEEDHSKQVEEQNLLGDAPGVKLVNMILLQAVRERASDVHFEPLAQDMRVRFRVDGILRDIMTVPRNLRADVSSRIKIMASLDITERRRPQDGRIQVELDGVNVDMRISTLPTVHGEKIVARLLNRSAGILSIEDFGFSRASNDRIERMLRQHQGLILATGPTGSGKTTTLYGFLDELNDPESNIITVEDPVEFYLKGVNQVQVNHRVGLSFAMGLRSVLRQDPDIIMVGEIRDQETAEIAVRSALTGHMVLSTLHTNSAVATIARLVDMEIEPYLISSTLVGVIAQRLVRRICPDCKVAVPLDHPLMLRFIRSLKLEQPTTVYEGKGCPACGDTGYRGRQGVEEVLLVNRRIREAIDQGEKESRLQQIAEEGGMLPLAKQAVQLLTAGTTTVAEVLRTVYSVEDEEDIHIHDASE